MPAQPDTVRPTVRPLIDFDQVSAGGDITINVPGERAARALPPEPTAGRPPDPVPVFAGREQDLAELRDRLRHTHRVCIHGLGGIGKSQLAIRYLNQHRSDYTDGCFWLRADQSATLVADLASLAWRLQLPERELPEQELQIEAVLRWLRDHEHWLLVIDNLDQPAAEALQHWLPPELAGHILTTSRSPQGSARLELRPLPLQIATRFLLQRTAQTDVVAATQLADRLGGLPLALEQASAYMEDTGAVISDYLRLLERSPGDLLGEGQLESYPEPVARTWSVSLQRVENTDPAAADLLRLCAFLAPDNIPIRLLRAGAELEQLSQSLKEMLADDLLFNRAIAALRRYSLITRQVDLIGVHRLVQAVVRDSLSPEQFQQWLAAALSLLGATFPTDMLDRQEGPFGALLLPHVQTVTALVREHSTVEPLPTRALLDRMATYLQARRQFGWTEYRTADGRRPVQEFLASISPRDQAAIVAAMSEARVEGLRVARHVERDLYELRTTGVKTQYRILFSLTANFQLLAIDVFIKDTARPPRHEIERARQRLQDWRSRGHQP